MNETLEVQDGKGTKGVGHVTFVCNYQLHNNSYNLLVSTLLSTQKEGSEGG